LRTILRVFCLYILNTMATVPPSAAAATIALLNTDEEAQACVQEPERMSSDDISALRVFLQAKAAGASPANPAFFERMSQRFNDKICENFRTLDDCVFAVVVIFAFVPSLPPRHLRVLNMVLNFCRKLLLLLPLPGDHLWMGVRGCLGKCQLEQWLGTTSGRRYL
jgi:hypothetical protein